MKLRFIMLGRTRRAECRDLFEDYCRRLGRFAEVEVTELREGSPASLKKLKLERGTTVLLDAAGRHFTSPQFARWLADIRDRGGRELTFLCGDAEGFPEGARDAAGASLSLSALTFPHEFARVMLAEQVYRAFTILSGHPYSK